MSRKSDRLAKLSVVAELARDAALSDMRLASDRRSHADLALADLDRQRRQLDVRPELPSTQAGADQTWQVWAARQRAELNMRLAKCMAAENEAKRHAARAFGRAEALSKLTRDLGR